MILKTEEILSFKEFCKKNNFYLSSDRYINLLNYLNSNEQDTKLREIEFIYHILPSNHEEKQKIKNLIEHFFNTSILENKINFVPIKQYDETFIDIFNSNNLNNTFNEIALDLINNYGEIDFSRPVSNTFWLNKIKQTINYSEQLTFFDIVADNFLDKLVNSQNKKVFQEQLNYFILEKIQELRNSTRDAYLPADLSPKEDLMEKDFLYTDSHERENLLRETKKLGEILANRFNKYSRSDSKGKLLFRKTIRKSLQDGGNFYNLILKPKIKRKPKLILMCDISGSMALYSLFGLTLLFGVVQRFSSVKTFVFIDGVTDISKRLRKIKINEVKNILNDWNTFVTNDGHSDYEKSFSELLEKIKSDGNHAKTLLVIGDARNNYRNIDRSLIKKINDDFSAIYWMNPERKQYWNTGDSQFNLFDEISTYSSEVRTYLQLKNFINNIRLNKVLR